MKKHTKKIWLIGLALFLALVLLAEGFLMLESLREVALYPELTIEVGSPLPEAGAFVMAGQRDSASYLSDVSAIDTNCLGSHRLTIRCKGKDHTVSLRIADTQPPTAQVQALTALQWQIPEAGDFLTEVRDATAVTATYLQPPDPTDPGPQALSILLTDQGGNTATLTVRLTLQMDTTAPVITGVQDQTLVEGSSISYRAGVSVSDDLDENVKLQIDAGGVDLSTPGSYTVTYSATDCSGNTTSVSATITVTKKEYQVPDIGPDDVGITFEIASKEEIIAMADKILASILTDGMTDKQKAEAIFLWVKGHVYYSGRSLGADFDQAAWLAMTRCEGDCRNFFAVTRLLLDRAGIPNIDVFKVPNSQYDSNHYWHLVSVDGGKTYYHMDTVPRMPAGYFFLLTDAQMDAYSNANYFCFNRDTSLYPPTPEEPPQ